MTSERKQQRGLPQVRYHPSIQQAPPTGGPKLLPQVRYHPSIRIHQNLPQAPPTSRPEPIKPQSPEPQSPEPQSPEPQSPEPRRPEPQSPEPQRPEPQRPEPRRPEPQGPEPQSPEPQRPEPQSPEPQSPEPQSPEPRRPEPQSPEPQRPEPQRPEPRRPEPQGPEPQSPEPRRPEPQSPATPLSPEQVLLGPLDRSVVDRVEVLTRGQSQNPAWFRWRRNRITASVAHAAANSRYANGKAPPTSCLARITGEAPRVQTRAMRWGVRMEAEAVRKYQEVKSDALGRPVLVRDCGLFLDQRRPWLAASPDGIVTDSRTGQWLLCLEVKCPYKHRHSRLAEACRDSAFCLQEAEPGAPFRLKSSHSYYTQIQVQLAVTGLDRADLVLFTLREVAVVTVAFDPTFWEETLGKLERFYRDAVVPHVQNRRAEP